MMKRSPSALTCRVLHTVAVIEAQHGAHRDSPQQPTRHSPSVPSAESTDTLTTPASPALPVLDSEMPPPRQVDNTTACSSTSASSPLCGTTQLSADVADLRAQREALQRRERARRQRVDAGGGVWSADGGAPPSSRNAHFVPSPTTADELDAFQPTAVRFTTSAPHRASHPHRRVCRHDGSRPQLWLHMPSRSADTTPVNTHIDTQTAHLVAPPEDPLSTHWLRANQRYERAYLCQERQLQARRPDLWGRALPHYAVLDGLPELMDNDPFQGFSRVRRVGQDDGMFLVQ